MTVHRTDLSAPIPLGYRQAIDRAIMLRSLGPAWSWRVVADVMRTYHGFDRSECWWRRELRGLVVARPRGRSFTGRVAA